jgi:excisionase family DNA binding protein
MNQTGQAASPPAPKVSGVETTTGPSLSAIEPNLASRLHPDDLRAILSAVRVQSPWLTAPVAADYIGCSLSRVRKLTMARELPHHKDGSRVLYHRDELDAYIRAGGAVSP